MGKSERHHYIPQFFIKGFVGDDGKVSVYNKETGKMDLTRKSPKQVFFAWNRNTFTVAGQETDFIEQIYQFSESKFSPTYKRLTEAPGPVEFTYVDSYHLIYFISEIHARVPNQDQEIFDYVKHLSPDNSLFKIRNKETGEIASKKVFDNIINEPAFIEASKMLKAIEHFFSAERDEKIDNWKLYLVPEESVHLALLGDNPVILRNSAASNIVKSELIFPLSKGKTIYHTNGKTLKQIPPEHRIFTDILTFLQADKMVCSPSGEYLADIATMAEKYNSEDGIGFLKQKVFDIFQ